MFADKYLKKQKRAILFKTFPNKQIGLIVVIPCFREPDILKTLESLQACTLPQQKVEIIVLINHSEKEEESTKVFNHKTKDELSFWASENKNKKLSFLITDPVELQKKWAGAGLARKSGMDEAIRRFNLIDKPNGIIVSLDADTLVEKNYLIEIEKHFQNNPKQVGATILFEHQKQKLHQKQLEGIELYEKYLNYYKSALDYSGYPYSMFTIGSAFAVTADAYVKRGGMNRRQAGEDFYFLQNLVQQGTVGQIKTTKVYPSARLSDRVPFGTGPILQKWMNGEEDLNSTYNLNAFTDLKAFFTKREKFFKMEEQSFKKLILKLPEPIQKFLIEDNFWNDLEDLNNNCSSLKTYQMRFFQKFNAFKILKYLNFAHDKFYEKAALIKQIELLKIQMYES